jgi:hypothetical protein
MEGSSQGLICSLFWYLSEEAEENYEPLLG